MLLSYLLTISIAMYCILSAGGVALYCT